MSHQQRTWVETTDAATGRPRWNVLVNGVPVPGGYVIATADGAFEAHYPHMTPFRKATLAEARERLEWAPPVTTGVVRIAREVGADVPRTSAHADVTSDGTARMGFLDPDEAAQALDVSVYRVNAMVANGALAARRTADGGYEVARSSIETVVARERAASATATRQGRDVTRRDA